MVVCLQMYCVDCGKEKPIFREGSCLECYVKNHEFIKGPEIFHIPVCSYCDAYKYKNTWKKESFEKIVGRYVKNAFSFNPELQNVHINIECHDKEDTIFCKVDFTGEIDDETVSEEHYIEVRLKPNVCDVCSKQFGGYHEAILQIRPEQKKLSIEKKDTIQRFVISLIQQMQEKGNRHVFLTDMGKKHGGLNFFISEKQAAYAIIKKIQEEFGGDIHVSSKNVGMKDGKQVYRYTYLVRLLPFEKEDVFKLNDEYFFVLNARGSQLHVINLKDHSDMFATASDLRNAIFIDTAENLSFTPIIINETESEFQLMHPKSYEIFFIKKPIGQKQYSTNLKILQINEYFFIEPGTL